MVQFSEMSPDWKMVAALLRQLIGMPLPRDIGFAIDPLLVKSEGTRPGGGERLLTGAFIFRERNSVAVRYPRR